MAKVGHRVKTRVTQAHRERFLELVRNGKDRQAASLALGFTGTTFRNLCRTDPQFGEQYEEAREAGAEYRASFVDWLAEGLIVVDADGNPSINPEAPPQVVLRWLERWNPAWKTGSSSTTVNVNSETENHTHVHVEGFAEQLRERLVKAIEGAEVVRVDKPGMAQLPPGAHTNGANGSTNGHRNGNH